VLSVIRYLPTALKSRQIKLHIISGSGTKILG
jgi:hypothetical protein